jgi:hypothetical protein
MDSVLLSQPPDLAHNPFVGIFIGTVKLLNAVVKLIHIYKHSLYFLYIQFIFKDRERCLFPG